MMNRYTSILFFACTLSATAQLSGTYTVGGNGANYATPAAAFAALNAQGANGDVTFLINPGTYCVVARANTFGFRGCRKREVMPWG